MYCNLIYYNNLYSNCLSKNLLLHLYKYKIFVTDQGEYIVVV